MHATDFEYAGQYLSDFGLTIGTLDGGGEKENLSAGSEIEFVKVARRNGAKHGLAGTKYGSCIQATIDIIKDPCRYENLEISDDDFRDLMRWLNRRQFLPFQAYDADEPVPLHDSCWFNASFNVERLTFGDRLYGLRLKMETDAPFGFGQKLTFKKVLSSGQSMTVYDMSDTIEFFCPDVAVKVLGDKDSAQIESDLTGTVTTFKHLYNGETIEMHGDTMIIESSFSPVNRPTMLTDDFNYSFVAIGNEYDNRVNNLTVNFPCEITVSYSPVIKSIV